MDLQQTKKDIENKIVEQLKTVYDPEIPVNIYDLGMIYGIKVSDDLRADILMTLTSPNCPVADSLPAEVRDKVNAIEEVRDAGIELTFDPPWDQEMMSEEARLELGFM
ncbi:MAG: DUF59 domain-containing protein [Bacteroidales bacterium]